MIARLVQQNPWRKSLAGVEVICGARRFLEQLSAASMRSADVLTTGCNWLIALMMKYRLSSSEDAS